jgi:hypothetical protein
MPLKTDSSLSSSSESSSNEPPSDDADESVGGEGAVEAGKLVEADGVHDGENRSYGSVGNISVF